MTTEWVDFKSLKEAVDMQMVLDHYGIKDLVKHGDDEWRGPCPIHRGAPRTKNFTVNVRKNAFKCFSGGCTARGNVLDFVAAMEQCSVRDAGLNLQEWFEIGDNSTASRETNEETVEATEVLRGIYSNQDGALFEVIATAKSAESLQRLVVYREIFDGYKFWVAPIENFSGGIHSSDQPQFTLVKAL
jgi:DNA primase